MKEAIALVGLRVQADMGEGCWCCRCRGCFFRVVCWGILFFLAVEWVDKQGCYVGVVLRWDGAPCCFCGLLEAWFTSKTLVYVETTAPYMHQNVTKK